MSDPSAIPPNSSFSRQLAGVVVNDQTALQVIPAMACIRLVSGVVSRMPLDAFTRSSGVRTPVEPEPQIIANPFGMPGMPGQLSRREGIRQGVMSLMMRGNAYYLVLARDKNGFPTLLMPVPPSQVVVRKVRGEITYTVNQTQVDPSDIIHLRWVTLPGGIVGLSPIEYAAQGLGISLAAEEYGARFFAQGASLSAVLQTDQPLSTESARRLAHDFQSKHGGLAQAHLPLILDGGLKYQAISLPPEQAQFLATREFQRGDIAMLFGVPPHLINDVDKSTSWGAGIEDQAIDFLRFTLEDYTSIFEDAWNAMTPPKVRTRFNFDALLRSNTVDRYNAYMVARTTGWMSGEEIRVLEDMPPSDDPALKNFAAPLNSAPKPAPGGGSSSVEGGDSKAL